MEYKVFTGTFRKAEGKLDHVYPFVVQALNQWCSRNYNLEIGRESLIKQQGIQYALVPSAKGLVKEIQSLLGDDALGKKGIYKGIRIYVDQFVSGSFSNLLTPINIDDPKSWEVFNSVTNVENRMEILRLKEFSNQFRTNATGTFKEYDVDNCRFALAANKVLNMLRGTKALELDLWVISKVYELRLLQNKSYEDLDTWMKYQPFENEELENKYIEKVKGDESLELGKEEFILSPDMHRNGDALNIVGKYLVSDMLFNLANWFGQQKKLVPVQKARDIEIGREMFKKPGTRKYSPHLKEFTPDILYVCETYMLPSQQIKAQVNWSKETGHSAYLERNLGQPVVYAINLPDLV